MGKVSFETDRCKGCSLCIDVCPKKILALNTSDVNCSGYYPISCTDMSKCIGCAFCAIICPDCVITVEK